MGARVMEKKQAPGKRKEALTRKSKRNDTSRTSPIISVCGKRSKPPEYGDRVLPEKRIKLKEG
jgi:hypothetical protein